MIVAKKKDESKKEETCPIHPGKPLIFYCENDGKLCCIDCNMSPEHQTHILYGIEDYLNTAKERLAVVADNYDDDVRRLEHLQELFSAYYERNDATWEKTAGDVRERFALLHELLDAQEQEALGRLEDTKGHSELTEAHKSVEDDLSQIDEVYGECIDAYEKLKRNEWSSMQEVSHALERIKDFQAIHDRSKAKVVFPEVSLSYTPPTVECAEDFVRKAWGSEVKVTILERIKGPSSVRVESVHGTTARITWSPVDLDYGDDVVYMVEMKRSGGANADQQATVREAGNNTFIELNDLKLDANFSVRVRGGIVDNGNNIWSDWSTPITFKVIDKLAKCPRDHDLVRTEAGALQRLFKAGSVPSNCAFCGKVLVGVTWACQRCNIAICDECVTYDLTHNFSGVCCARHHKLIRMAMSIRLKSNSKTSSTTSGGGGGDDDDDDCAITCNLCRKYCQDTPSAMVFHCPRCDYDLCNKCGEELMQDIYKSLKCSSGHQLVKIFIDDRLGRRSSCSCNVCGSRLLKGSMIRVFMCYACGFDMCERCAHKIIAIARNAPLLKCGKGHQLDVMTIKQRLGKGFLTAICTRCGKSMRLDNTRPDYPIMRCHACNYDLCAECAGLRVN